MVETFDQVAQRQYGLVTRRQAICLLGEWAFRRARAEGRLVDFSRGVFRCAGARRSFRQRAMGACLAYGPPVAVSHRSAAALWGYEPVARVAQIDVVIPHGRSGRRPGIEVHHAALSTDCVTERFGIAVTSPGRTLLDLAGIMPPSVLERCVDDVLRTRQATATQLIAWLGRGKGRGQNRIRLLRLLELRSSSGVGDSVAVDRIHRWISHAGLPAPVLGWPVVVAGHQRVLDLAYPIERIAIEFNGWEYHQMRSRMDADHARTTELELAGWIVIVVTAAHTEAATVDRVTRALALRAGEARSGMLGR
jgi:hypothetical protein